MIQCNGKLLYLVQNRHHGKVVVLNQNCNSLMNIQQKHLRQNLLHQFFIQMFIQMEEYVQIFQKNNGLQFQMFGLFQHLLDLCFVIQIQILLQIQKLQNYIKLIEQNIIEKQKNKLKKLYKEQKKNNNLNDLFQINFILQTIHFLIIILMTMHFFNLYPNFHHKNISKSNMSNHFQQKLQLLYIYYQGLQCCLHFQMVHYLLQQYSILQQIMVHPSIHQFNIKFLEQQHSKFNLHSCFHIPKLNIYAILTKHVIHIQQNHQNDLDLIHKAMAQLLRYNHFQCL